MRIIIKVSLFLLWSFWVFLMSSILTRIIMQSVIIVITVILSVIFDEWHFWRLSFMTIVIILCVVILITVILSAIKVGVVMPSVVRASVAAPFFLTIVAAQK
jgi:hypothetical protein